MGVTESGGFYLFSPFEKKGFQRGWLVHIIEEVELLV